MGLISRVSSRTYRYKMTTGLSLNLTCPEIFIDLTNETYNETKTKTPLKKPIVVKIIDGKKVIRKFREIPLGRINLPPANTKDAIKVIEPKKTRAHLEIERKAMENGWTDEHAEAKRQQRISERNTKNTNIIIIS